MTSPASAPAVAPTARLQVLDGLRGFALLGIILINVMPFSAAPGGPPDFFSAVPVLDRALQSVVLAVIESKFFSLFSLLFGLGFAIQIDNAARRGAAFLPRISRRLAALLVFGLLHVLLVWDGDILVIYAVVGGLLLLFRGASDRLVLRWAVGLLVVPLAVYLVLGAGLAVARVIPAAADALRPLDAEFADAIGSTIRDQADFLGSASWVEIARARLADYLQTLPLLVSRIPTVLAMFLLGLWVGRRGLLRDVEAHAPFLRRLARVAWVAGLPVQLLVVAASLTLPPLNAIVALFFDQAFTGPVLAVAYASTLVLWSRTRAGATVLRWFAWPGRMALTTYLGQSVAMSFVFWSWGLALVGRVNTAEALAIAAGIFVVQALIARLWLSVFGYGPLEWLWRAATYWRFPPLLRQREPA